MKIDLTIILPSKPAPEDRPRPSVVETWFLKHGHDLGRFLRRYVRNEHDVEECVQETFLKVWRQEQRGTLNGETHGYLFKTALNVARDRHRRNVVRRTDVHDVLNDDAIQSDAPDAESSVHWGQGLRQLEESLQGLKPSTRRVFLLHHVEQLTYPEIASRLGVTTRTIEREMARALTHCMEKIQPFLADR